MNQTTLQKDSVCGNKQFRACTVDENTHKCVNCEKSFNDGLKDGDHVVGECETCNKTGVDIEITWRYVDGTFDGDCQECTKAHKAIDKLYEDFRGEGYGYEEEYKNFTNEKFDKDLEAGVEAISNLSKEHLKFFLKQIHNAVER